MCSVFEMNQNVCRFYAGGHLLMLRESYEESAYES